ncbi:hypothetical protein NH286_07550 [Anaerococcus sp. NML200574]|uniref:Lipoprotein n=1 Tax=Anaerococcus kampingae TaxID=3115614 RepID=A0ABW9MGE5_9FIRM|nr:MULTISPECIES: hypothetical protein [unclassified Anaerococcus]MCW6679009.1 hypothetical protein [Anaerococcus sp. NML200574]
MKKFLLIWALALAITGCNKEANLEEGAKISQTKTDVDALEYVGEEKKLDFAYNTYSLKGLDTEKLEMNLFAIKDGEVSNFVDGPLSDAKENSLLGIGFNENSYIDLWIEGDKVTYNTSYKSDSAMDKDYFNKTYWLDQADIKDKESNIVFVGMSKDDKDIDIKNITKEDLKKMTEEDKELKILAFELILDKR